MDLDIFNTLFSNIWAIFLVIAFFGGSIFIHELGHFLAAKRRGLKVERFSIGFGPKLFGWKKDGVEYRISLFPLGGYVSLPQLADLRAIEGSSEKGGGQLPKISYTDKMIVSVMGAVFNLIFAFLLATILWGVGQPSSKEAQTTTIGYVPEEIHLNLEKTVPGPAHVAGLRPGDVVLQIDGHEIESFQDIQQTVVTGSGRAENSKPETTFKVKRGNEILTFLVKPELVQFNELSGDEIRAVGVQPEQGMIVKLALPNSPAAEAGLKNGDLLVSVDGIPLYSLATLSDYINKDTNREVTLKFERKGKEIEALLKPKLLPYTKPMMKLSVTGDDKAWVEFLPAYKREKQPSELTDPKTESELIAYDKGDSTATLGIKLGDKLLSVNGEKINSLQALKEITPGKEELLLEMQNGERTYKVKINGVSTTSMIEPKTQAMIGVQLERNPILVYTNPATQFYNTLSMTFRTLHGLLSKDSDLKVQNLMGPPGIVRALHSFTSQDFRLVLWFTMLLNINLAIINLLPIPVLDGGHMAFATLERLRRKALPINMVAGIQGSFMILLFGLMLYVSFFDVRRWQGDSSTEDRVKRQQSLYIPTKFSDNSHNLPK